MINNFIADQIRANFGFEPTFEQSAVIHQLSEFILSGNASEVFLLRGFAGTGKTSLVAALVKTLDALKQHVVLMAPTGRAAKVFALYSGHPAYTIHRRIYRQKSLTDETSFSLCPNLTHDTLFIVDEASMIGDGVNDTSFGSGCLLDDLFRFVYSGEGCRLLLLGDTAQLPPVGLDESPALSPQRLSHYGTEIKTMELTRVMRQDEMSGILENATAIRERICQLADRGKHTGLASLKKPLRLRCMPDVQSINGSELIEKISDSYSDVGEDETMIICRSNKNANIYNRGIRATILYREEELCSGDHIMIVKNNYFWIKEKAAGEETSSPTFLANGDMAVVRRIRRTRELFGFRFADVQLILPDYDDYELEATVLLDTLTSESPSLTKEEHQRLFDAVMEDYADLPNKTDRYKKLREDIYYNALQIKHAYAVTCHKAQGGQWDTVFIDQGWLPPEAVGDIQYYRWLYTAFTRATHRVYLVNWRKEEIEELEN
ncbi:MAG: AAA family ATPase [Bacteroidaceae bacterium]|nr:AAA family ATPase [Bacteroidaceae bacterium]